MLFLGIIFGKNKCSRLNGNIFSGEGGEDIAARKIVIDYIFKG